MWFFFLPQNCDFPAPFFHGQNCDVISSGFIFLANIVIFPVLLLPGQHRAFFPFFFMAQFFPVTFLPGQHCVFFLVTFFPGEHWIFCYFSWPYFFLLLLFIAKIVTFTCYVLLSSQRYDFSLGFLPLAWIMTFLSLSPSKKKLVTFTWD